MSSAPLLPFFFLISEGRAYTSASTVGSLKDKERPTPVSSKKDLVEKNTPIFSHEAGFYEEAFYLSISSADKEGIIYYTLDGSEPTLENVDNNDERIGYRKKTFIYTEPIYIPSGNREKKPYLQKFLQDHICPTFPMRKYLRPP